MNAPKAKFAVGDIVDHLRFGYRGVIYDIDPEFKGTDEWYALVAKSRPPKDEPWYHVLVDQARHTTYVAEQNLTSAECLEPITHPEVDRYFNDFSDGHYHRHTH